MADRTHKGTCPIPKCPPSSPLPASPGSPPLTWSAFLAYRGSSPWLPLHCPPPTHTHTNQSLVIPLQTRLRRRTRLLTAARLKGGRPMKPVAVGTSTRIIKMHHGTAQTGGSDPPTPVLNHHFKLVVTLQVWVLAMIQRFMSSFLSFSDSVSPSLFTRWWKLLINYISFRRNFSKTLWCSNFTMKVSRKMCFLFLFWWKRHVSDDYITF